MTATRKPAPYYHARHKAPGSTRQDPGYTPRHYAPDGKPVAS